MRNLLPILDNGAGHLVGIIGFGPVASDSDCQVLGRVFTSDFWSKSLVKLWLLLDPLLSVIIAVPLPVRV